ncbi:MAG TPA: EFR1 family ferrodoxin [Candidatus Thermoplasmatota archaeon]|nr:EFR1 family ferrodoxin [Candidatus Thermoplasmatota archaeon]
MTRSTIYYFSGTGNSFAVAKDIAVGLDADLASIPKMILSKTCIIESEVVGFVFPDYHSDIPNIVKLFLKSIPSLQNKYVFGVCTFGGNGPGLTMKYLKKLVEVKQGSLSAGFAVHMPYNYVIPSFSLKPFGVHLSLKNVSDDKMQKLFNDWKTKQDEIIDFVKKRKSGVFETSGDLLLTIVNALKLKESLGKVMWLKMSGLKNDRNMSFSESRKLMDAAFFANGNCIHCRTCEQICPVSNIKFVEEKPSWLHQCEQCFACLQFCPSEAIQFGNRSKDAKRYHHPLVKPEDLIIN